MSDDHMRRRIAAGIFQTCGLGEERLRVMRQPDGPGVLFSVHVPDGEALRVAEALRENARGHGFAAFASDEEPETWE